MLAWVLQTTILSIVFIWLVHYLFNYFKDTLTVPKVKDLVNEPSKKYKNMYQVINRQSKDNLNFDESAGSTPIHQLRENLLPKNDGVLTNPYNALELSSSKNEMKNEMKNELKNFLKKQINR